jgi:glycosyltransferase involved in cell wall biosynthesis
MRIAVIAPPWAPVPPDLYGGTEAVVDRLARGYRDRGHDVLLYTTGDSTSPVPRAWCLPEAEGNRMGMSVPELRHVMSAYAAVADFDVVHDHTVIGPVYSACLPNLPVVTTNHGRFDGELTPIYQQIADRVSIVAISAAQRSAAPNLKVARIIHHGIDASSFPLGRGDGGYALFLGRMSPDKGAHRAIEAAAKAGVPLFMAAKMREPWEFDYFERLVRPRLSSDVHYLGEIPHDEKLSLIAGARALLNPIRWPEPFGLVMLEALACGTPVLTFPEGAAPEIIEHGVTGYLCADEADMADAIGRLDRLDREACRRAVEGHFSADRMVDEHLELLETVARR